MTKFYITKSDELYHYGVKGMKWGVRHDYEPVGRNGSSHEGSSNRRSENQNSKSNTNNGDKSASSIKSRGENAVSRMISGSSDDGGITSNLKKKLGVTDTQAAQIKKWAKIAGISLATAAGVYAAGYYFSHHLATDVNVGGGLSSFSINNLLKQDGGLSQKAMDLGYKQLQLSDFLDDAIETAGERTSKMDYDALMGNVCDNLRDKSARYRLSCWSASQAYYNSAMTGKEFAARSFDRKLVNFNNFGKLYKEKPQIFDAFGHSKNNFVGSYGADADNPKRLVSDFISRFGNRRLDDNLAKGMEAFSPKNAMKYAYKSIFSRANEDTAKSLCDNIFKNAGNFNNLSADGTRTIGFVNAGYHSLSCTHEWNFELVHGSNGNKILNMVDCYYNKRYDIGSMDSLGNITYSGLGFDSFCDELRHYNQRSIRFYAPSINSINTNEMQRVIVGRMAR